jgi:hypothetical protein
MYHEGVICAHSGALRVGVTARIRFDHPLGAHGYALGREAYFHDPGPRYHYRESEVRNRFHELLLETPGWKASEAQEIWIFASGCLPGEFSGMLFPQTPAEDQTWRKGSEQRHVRQGQQTSVAMMPAAS